MPPFYMDYHRTLVQRIVTNVLLQGPIPQHIGIILDGNRRYAKNTNLDSPTQGHQKGCYKLSQVCKMMADMGIPTCTVYFCSLDNLNRSPAEVNGLMAILAERMQMVLEELEQMKEQGYGIEIVGDYKLAPHSSLKNIIAKAMWATKDHSTFRLNIAFAYTGQSEIAKGLNVLLCGLLNGDIKEQDLDDTNLVQCISTLIPSSPVDVIIRPGGDERLSDFMMWQGSNAHLAFIEGITWPEFTFGHLLQTIWQYQMGSQREVCRPRESLEGEQRKAAFADKVRERCWAEVRQIAEGRC